MPLIGFLFHPPPPLLPPPFLLVQVRRTWGLQRSNRSLAEALCRALHGRLRWSGTPLDTASLAALHLQVGGGEGHTLGSSVDWVLWFLHISATGLPALLPNYRRTGRKSPPAHSP